MKIAALIIVLGCMAAGSVIFFLKGISVENGMEEVKATAKQPETEIVTEVI